MKRVSRRAQASSEYLIVSSLTLLIIIPAVFAFFQYSSQKTLQIEENQIVEIGNRLMIETKQAYFGGQDTKITINERFPAILDNITFIPYVNQTTGKVLTGGEYVIYYESQQSGIGALSIGYPVNVNVSLDSSQVLWGQGLRSLVFTAQTNQSSGNLFVNLTVQ